MIYGSIPAAGLGSRLQPLAYSKELALVGEKAVIEYLIERMVIAGIKKIFITINPDKLDIPKYIATKSPYKDYCVFIVNYSKSLPDSIYGPARFLKKSDFLYFGLPDTIWYPRDGYVQLKNMKGKLVFGLFDSKTPSKFDAVSIDKNNKVKKIEVKVPNPSTKWTWGIGKIKVSEALKMLDMLPEGDESVRILGNIANTYINNGNSAHAVRIAKSHYIDIGRKEDYHRANKFVKKHESHS